MKVFLLKLLLLLLFLALLFLFLWVLEGITWYETGLVSISQILDPLSLSTRKLKILLDGRGISYDGVVEKQELTALVEASGDVMEGELRLLEQEEEEVEQSTSFSSGPHFYEEVEDKKDSIWLIQITPRGKVPLLEQETWKTVVKKVSHFGIRTGTFNCAHDNRFCRQKGWTQPILMLAMPQGLNQKDSVVMAAYPLANYKASKVMNWVSTRLARTVHQIDEDRLVKNWLEASAIETSRPSIRLVLLSDAEEGLEAPLFFSAISLKYSGRIKFGQAFLHKSMRNVLQEKFRLGSKSSQYLLTTPEGIISYGTRGGEYLNHHAMDVYLGTIYPQTNDFFMLSFLIGNMLCMLELSMNHGDVLAKRLFQFLWALVKYNVVLIMLWLPMLALTQLPCLVSFFSFCQKVLRLASQTAFASELRCMWIMHSHRGSLILVSFLLFCAVIGYIRSRCGSGEEAEEAEEGSSSREWLQSTLVHFYNVLVRPSPGFTPVLMSNARVEEGMNWERLIRPQMFPNLFLLADVSQDYLKDLPTWRYHQREGNRECPSAEICQRCTTWHSCFVNDEKRHQENCQLLREYFKERDKKLGESKVCGKNSGKRGRKNHCRKCLPTGRYASDPKRGEPFLVTDSPKPSDFSENTARKKSPEFPFQPENIGSVTSDSSMKAKIEANALQRNLESCPNEKLGPETKPCDNSVESPETNNGLKVIEPVCDCGLDLGPTGGLATSDPWPECMIQSLECSICLEAYLDGIELCGLPCGHAFHLACVQVWLTTNRHHCCPNCRWPAYKPKDSKLFKQKEK